MKPCDYSCGTAEHLLSRRHFFQSLAATGAAAVMPGFGLFTSPTMAAEMARQQKRMIVINMAGGLSQLESWDPKPGTATGGPFRAIPTSVPGLHISELLPKTARIMHHLALIRGINTHEDDHGKGAYIMETGRRKSPAQEYPVIGAVVAKVLDKSGASALPGHIVVSGLDVLFKGIEGQAPHAWQWRVTAVGLSGLQPGVPGEDAATFLESLALIVPGLASLGLLRRRRHELEHAFLAGRDGMAPVAPTPALRAAKLLSLAPRLEQLASAPRRPHERARQHFLRLRISARILELTT